MQINSASADEIREQQLQDVRQLIGRYAAAKSKRVYLEEFRKVKKAVLMKQAESDGCNSIQKQEREAYAHPDYHELLKGLEAATAEETAAYWELKQVEWKFEAWRTRMATERVERGRY